jgi:peptide/nickel transport system substrate-binding protein
MTWNLQEGVQWHDGEEFTSEDVCFTWEFIASEAGAAVYNQTEYLHITECDDSDPYTVVFTWDGPYAPYASLFDTVLPEHVLAGQDVVTYDAYNRSPLGTGPFKFVEWQTGEYVRVEKNENYWRGPEYPKLDGVIVQFIPDPNTRVNALKAGEYDFGQILPNQVAEVADLEGYKIELVNTNSWLHFDFNVATERGQALFGDKAVRQAIAHAIDRESIVNDLMEGTVELANTGITPNSPYFNADVKAYNYDPDLAAQMLEEAGWTVGSDGIREKEGERLSFTIINRNSRPERIAIAQVIQANLKDVGVEVLFENLENAAWLERWLSTEWEAVVGGWIIPADPSLTSLYGCEASNNFTGFCSEELDAAMEASDQVLDFAERKPLVDEVQAILAEEAWALPLYYAVNPFVLREDFENFKGSGTNLGSYWNSYEWDFGN